MYVLRYQSGYFYVGQSGDIQNRVLQHIQTAASRPYGDIYKVEYGDRLLTPESSNLNGQERDETIERMLEHGIDRVRGWEFTDRQHTIESLQTIKQLIIGNTNCCRTCGFRGHFASNCNTHEDFASTWLCEWLRLQTNNDPPQRPSPQRPSPQRPSPQRPSPQRPSPQRPNRVINLVDERHCERCYRSIQNQPYDHYLCYSCWPG